MKTSDSHRRGRKQLEPRRRDSALPFSRPFLVDTLRHADAIDVVVEADQNERAALARIDGVVAIDRLRGEFRVTRQGVHGARVVGEIEAAVVQTCVVTLDPFPVSVHETVDISFAPTAEAAQSAAAAARDREGDIALENRSDPPDPLIDGQIDLGLIAAEFLALGLDPYPRKPGATFDSGKVAPPGADGPGSPFAALHRLMDGKS